MSFVNINMLLLHSYSYDVTSIRESVWRRVFHIMTVLCVLVLPVPAVAFTLQIGDKDVVPTPIAGNVQSFVFTVEINAPLAAGIYENPPLEQIKYQVSGEPIVGSPSGFDAFALMRSISGTEFYREGNELVFEIAEAVVLSDGVQAVELVGSAIVLSFDAREEGTGRFHPARLELHADGTGLLQNSDNVPDIANPEGIPEGSEYVTEIAFDPGNLTLFVLDDSGEPEPIDSQDAEEDVLASDENLENSSTSVSESSGGSTGIALLLVLVSQLFRRK